MINSFTKIKRLVSAQPAGFTLIETLIAVLVLMLAIAGPLTLASKGLQATLIAKDQDTAYYLAQDAIEYVRWVRDTNKLCIAKGGCTAASWLAGLDGTTNGHTTNNSGGTPGDCSSANGCTVDSLKDTVTTCSSSPCAALNFDSANNYFTYAATNGTTIAASPFTRTVKIAKTVGTNDCTGGGHGCEASVAVTVTWLDSGGVARSISVREDMFDWQ